MVVATLLLILGSVDLAVGRDRGPRPGGIHPRVDFDGDGRQDLAIGIPGESVGGKDGAGAVLVLYGEGTKGPTTARTQLLHQDRPSTPDRPEARDGFGTSLAAGDFDGDSFSDLAIGIPGEDVTDGSVSYANAGAVQTFVGTPDGLTAVGGAFYTDAPPSVGARLGAAMAPTDMLDAFTGEDGSDELADVAVGAPGFNGARGRVVILAGGYLADDAPGTELRSYQPDVPPGTQTGAALVSAEFADDAASPHQLAIGQPGFDIPAAGTEPGVTDAGRVVVLWDASAGFVEFISQRSSRIADDAENGDRFGEVLAVGDVNDAGWNDLVVGVPREDIGARADAGMVIVIVADNTGSGIGPPNNASSIALTLGSAARAGDRLGAAVAVHGFGAGPSDHDIAAGIPGRDVGGRRDAGAVRVWETVGGIVGGGLVQTISQESAGVADAAEAGDRFGSVLIDIRIDAGTGGDLIIGTPAEDIDGVVDAGMVQVLVGDADGLLTGQGGRTITQRPAAVPDVPERGDRLGASLHVGD